MLGQRGLVLLSSYFGERSLYTKILSEWVYKVYTGVTMPKPQVMARVDQRLKNRVEELSEKRDVTQSEVVRELLETGIREHDNDSTGETTARLGLVESQLLGLSNLFAVLGVTIAGGVVVSLLDPITLVVALITISMSVIASALVYTGKLRE